jgi:uncharacterized protein YecE (DUF72 family)
LAELQTGCECNGLAYVVTTPTKALYLGTSGWAYGSWKPGFYPAKLPAKDFLKAYAGRLNTVEVNYTFRQLPSAKQLENWLSVVPTDFRFSFKAPQRITHILRLRDAQQEWAALVDALAPVVEARKMAAVLLQFPPNFRAMAAGKDKRKNIDALTDFLQGIAERQGEPGLRIACEFRDASWFCEETYVLLRKHGAALCLAENDTLVTPEVQTAEFSYYRLRRSGYSELELQQTYTKLEQSALQGEAYAYFMHEEPPDGALRAESLLQMWMKKHPKDAGQK